VSCRPKARRAAGQATVELALGTLVFVTLLTAGIYLAETSFLALKVHERVCGRGVVSERRAFGEHSRGASERRGAERG